LPQLQSPSERVSFGAIALALLGACRGPGVPPTSTPRSEPTRLSFIDDFNAPRPEPVGDPAAPQARWDAALGGLSGLYYSPHDASLYAVSDRSKRFPPRLYTFAVELSDSELRVTPKSVVLLHEHAPSGLLVDLDCESITGDSSGAFFVGTENSDDNPTQRWPSILRVSRDGLLSFALPLPRAFLGERTGVPTRGPRSNLAFEGLSLSPSGRWLSAITESALRQDGPAASFEQGTRVRILRWDLSAPGEPAELSYQTEPVPRLRSGEPIDPENGVSELLSLDDRRLLVLERAYVAVAGAHGTNSVRIFESVIREGSPASATSEAQLPPLLAKRLVLDLDDVLGQLEPGQQSLDNFEGMTLGPKLPSGERSLLLVSDDNFSSEQRTVFLALRLQSGTAAP
jgi:hypothetical protein